MADYGWIITRDHLHEESPSTFDSEEGTMGPYGITPDMTKRLLNGEGEGFRLLDDDGEVYYTGRRIGGDGSEPLMDFGAPNAGCTMLQERVSGRWETVIA